MESASTTLRALPPAPAPDLAHQAAAMRLEFRHPHARFALPCFAAAALAAASLVATLPWRAQATPPRITADHFLCPEQAPRFDYCTNSVHPHFWLRMNTGTTNGGHTPGGSVGIRMRL